jgi:type VI secretion system secreted protein VgrG
VADGLVTVQAELTIAGEPLRVLWVTVHERLSEVPHLLCEVTVPDLATAQGVPDPETLVGKPLALTLRRVDGSQSRSFAGVVIDAQRYADNDGMPMLRIEAAPRLWKLGKRADCHIYQTLSVPDIAKKVLEAAGLSGPDVEDKLTGSYDTRVYTVQYRETDLHFLARLFSEEGIYFTVEYADGKDKIVLGDDPQGLGPVAGTTSLPFGETFGFATSHDHVMALRHVHQVRSDKVFVRDYDFERPKLKLEASVEGKDPGTKALEVYEYPGRFIDQGVGSRYAQVLLDSMQAERDVVTGETTTLTFEPGLKFTVTDHPYDPLNQEYLITSVETEEREPRAFADGAKGGKSGRDYVCRFTAVPTAKTDYRPPRKLRERPVSGVQTAVTTGPGGEIYTNKNGQVKVKFPWDRVGKPDDTSSSWMRTSQVPTGGSMLLPRMGWEVALRYIEGDVDQPMVMSRLYNATSPPPYPLPANKARGSMQTATTPGGGSSNEFRMDDTKGKEEMFFNASKDMTVDVVNNTTEAIKNNETVSIGSNHKLNVTNSVTATVGASQTLKVSGNQTVNVETFMVDQIGGDHTLSISGNRTMMIGGDHRREVGGASKTDTSTLQVDLVVGSVTDSTSGAMKHDVGAALVQLTVKDISVMVAGDHTESAGALKIVLAKGGRGVAVTGSMNEKVAGAIIDKVDGDHAEKAGTMFTEVAAGAHIVKADTVVYEAETLVTFVMGASVIILTPASISIAGVSVKIDAATDETAALVMDN